MTVPPQQGPTAPKPNPGRPHPAADDRRGSPRVNAPFTVDCVAGAAILRHPLINLSDGGVFIGCAQPLPLDSEVTLRFALPEHPAPLTVRGKVVWTNPHAGRFFPQGMGVKFLQVPQEHRAALNRYIQSQLGSDAGGDPAKR
ncbi:MAG: TIGR02266 family protein [Deltaproteobacteria bacterium]|nr:TIGR02266 family protein [Deltaproteobacteria bacterium]MBI3075961.1 TIGR02266 family protein [Deltaproteobacteria bacterium]